MFDFRSEEERTQEKINNIEKCQKYISDQEKVVEKEQYTLKLFELDLVDRISIFTTEWDYMCEYLGKAQEEISKKKKSERTNIDFITSKLSKTFLKGDTIKIKNSTLGGLEGYYIEFEFEYKGNEYIISIPQRRRLTYDNLKYAYYGKFAFIKRDSEYCVSVLFTEWTEEKLAEDIEKYFQNS